MRPEPSSFCYMRGVRKTGCLFTPQNSSPAAGCLPYHVAWRKLSTSTLLAHVQPPQWSLVVGTRVLQPWPTAEIVFCAFITPSHGGAKAMIKLEELNLTTAVAGREERACVIPSSRNRLTWSLILLGNSLLVQMLVFHLKFPGISNYKRWQVKCSLDMGFLVL